MKSASGNVVDIVGKLPKSVFRLELESLETGDVIASTMPHDPVSRAIRLWTRGTHSHVALVLSRDRIIEADTTGVMFKYPYLYVAESLSSVRVLRPKTEIINFSEDLEAVQALYAAASLVCWARYGTAKAMAIAIPPIRLIAKDESYFCSELVARLYLACGVHLVPGIAPELITPKAIAGSSAFTDVTGDCFTPTDRDELIAIHGEDIRTVEGTSAKRRPELLEVIAATIQEDAAKAGVSIAEREINGDNLKIQNDFQQTVLWGMHQNRDARLERLVAAVERAGKQVVIAHVQSQLDKAAKELFTKVRVVRAIEEGQMAATDFYLEQARRAVQLQTIWVAHLTGEKGFIDGSKPGDCTIYTAD